MIKILVGLILIFSVSPLFATPPHYSWGRAEDYTRNKFHKKIRLYKAQNRIKATKHRTALNKYKRNHPLVRAGFRQEGLPHLEGILYGEEPIYYKHKGYDKPAG